VLYKVYDPTTHYTQITKKLHNIQIMPTRITHKENIHKPQNIWLSTSLT
jgi:hypothetical protein